MGASGLRVRREITRTQKGRIVRRRWGVYTTSQKLRILPSIPYSQTFCQSVQFYYDIRHDLIFYHVKSMLSVLVAFK
jgi:hypothetical protein